MNQDKVGLVGDTADAQVGGEVKTEAGAGPFLDEYQLPTILNPVFKWGAVSPGDWNSGGIIRSFLISYYAPCRMCNT